MDTDDDAILAVLDRVERLEHVEHQNHTGLSSPQQVEDSNRQGTHWLVTGSMLLGGAPSASDPGDDGRGPAGSCGGGDLKTVGSFGATTRGNVSFADLSGEVWKEEDKGVLAGSNMGAGGGFGGFGDVKKEAMDIRPQHQPDRSSAWEAATLKGDLEMLPGLSNSVGITLCNMEADTFCGATIGSSGRFCLVAKGLCKIKLHQRRKLYFGLIREAGVTSAIFIEAP
ncbi:hypothetical protein ACA910_011217 [Epithemia clementina (nom. ined.)]